MSRSAVVPLHRLEDKGVRESIRHHKDKVNYSVQSSLPLSKLSKIKSLYKWYLPRTERPRKSGAVAKSKPASIEHTRVIRSRSPSPRRHISHEKKVSQSQGKNFSWIHVTRRWYIDDNWSYLFCLYFQYWIAPERARARIIYISHKAKVRYFLIYFINASYEQKISINWYFHRTAATHKEHCCKE